MEYAIAQHRFCTISYVDNRYSLGNNMGIAKKPVAGRCANVDTLDITPPACRPANEPVLESINPAGIFMYADIGYLEGVFNVII
jgi:hypothetical protein